MNQGSENIWRTNAWSIGFESITLGSTGTGWRHEELEHDEARGEDEAVGERETDRSVEGEQTVGVCWGWWGKWAP
jgi:hypothetical protein